MVEFERRESGLLVPELPPERTKEPGRLHSVVNSVGLGTVVNGMMVLIQLFTVWILWKTYQDTVIPNRQKELLAEQVANLEIEQAARTKEVENAKKRMTALNSELAEKRSSLARLSEERKDLLSDAQSAQLQANSARTAQALAIDSARKARSSLEATQWNIYSMTAGSILSLPHMILTRKSSQLKIAGIGAKDSKAAFHTYLIGIEKIWPDMREYALLVEHELRRDESAQTPRWMADEFANYFALQAHDLRCTKPDFASIRAEIDAKFDLAATAAVESARKAQADRQATLDEAMKRNVLIPYPDSVKQREVEVSISNATYMLIDEAEKDITLSLEECANQFRPIGERFFASKNAIEPHFPSSVIREFNNSARSEEEPDSAPETDVK